MHVLTLFLPCPPYHSLPSPSPFRHCILCATFLHDANTLLCGTAGGHLLEITHGRCDAVLQLNRQQPIFSLHAGPEGVLLAGKGGRLLWWPGRRVAPLQAALLPLHAPASKSDPPSFNLPNPSPPSFHANPNPLSHSRPTLLSPPLAHTLSSTPTASLPTLTSSRISSFSYLNLHHTLPSLSPSSHSDLTSTRITPYPHLYSPRTLRFPPLASHPL